MSENTSLSLDGQETGIDEQLVPLSPDAPYTAVEIRRYARMSGGLSKPLVSDFGVWNRVGGVLLVRGVNENVAHTQARSKNEELRLKNAGVPPPGRGGRGGP
jgi:hypothetical protein